MDKLNMRARLVRRALRRGVTLVEVLIVVAIMAVIAGGATYLVFPEFKKARIKAAYTGATTIKTAAQVYMEMDMSGGPDTCPTMQDLVNAKKLDQNKTLDPWGMPYKIACVEGDIRVISPGADKKENTPDDVRDDAKPADLEKLGKM
jgi:general secretion pathway protein G